MRYVYVLGPEVLHVGLLPNEKKNAIPAMGENLLAHCINRQPSRRVQGSQTDSRGNTVLQKACEAEAGRTCSVLTL